MSFLEGLPVEKRAGMSTRSAGAAFLGTIAVFILINFGLLLYVDTYPPEFGPWLVEAKWRLLLNLDEPKEVLVLGDSTANQALLPERIEEATGLTTINLGTVASLTSSNDVWMLQQYVSEHSAPELVVIVHSYQTWLRPIVQTGVGNIPFFRVNSPSVLSPSLPLVTHDFAEQRLLRFIPAYSQSGSLRRLVRTILQLPPDFRLLGGKQYSISELGAYSVEDQDAGDLREDIDEHQRFVNLPIREVTRENLAAVARLIELAEEYDLEVYILNAPIADELAETIEFKTYFAPIQEFLVNAFEGTRITYIPDVYATPLEHMESADHLLIEGARLFTDQVIETVIVPSQNN
jgi:hypothetical protein